MALDKVVGDILESARKDADQLLQSADKEKSSILQNANEMIAGKKKESEKQLEDTLKRLRQQEISSAELEAKRVVLNARKEALDQAFEGALKDLASMSDADKTRLYAKIMAQGTKVIPQPKVLCAKGDGKLISGMPGIGSMQEMDMDTGLILESEDGMFRLDYRFKTILKGVWEKELKNVSNILFG